MIAIRKFVVIVLLYVIFSFVFLKVAWGNMEAGASARLETNFSIKETFVSPNFDLRPIKLSKYLRQKNSPLADYSTQIINLSDRLNIAWSLFPAISGVESGYCMAYIKYTNNCVGWGGGYITFSSMNKQIEVVLTNLKDNYIDQGLTSVDLIGAKYAADPSWSLKVQRHMNAIETTEIL